MSTQHSSFYSIRKSDLSPAGAAMGDAFQDDPVWNGIFEGNDNLPVKFAAAMEIPMRHCFRYGKLTAISEDLEGIAATVPGSHANLTLLRMILAGSLGAAMKMGSRAGKLMGPVFAPLEKDRRENMKGRAYTYLFVLGVQKKFQGKGYGSTLLKKVIEKADSDGVPIYLETERESLVQFYEKFGFTVIKKIELPHINLPMWEMIREAKK